MHIVTGMSPSTLFFGVSQRNTALDTVVDYLGQAKNSNDAHDLEQIRSNAIQENKCRRITTRSTSMKIHVIISSVMVRNGKEFLHEDRSPEKAHFSFQIPIRGNKGNA